METNMTTAQQREAEFRKDFEALLAKHNAAFKITDDGADWGAQVGIVEITMPSEYTDDNEEVKEFAEFRL